MGRHERTANAPHPEAAPAAGRPHGRVSPPAPPASSPPRCSAPAWPPGRRHHRDDHAPRRRARPRRRRRPRRRSRRPSSTSTDTSSNWTASTGSTSNTSHRGDLVERELTMDTHVDRFAAMGTTVEVTVVGGAPSLLTIARGRIRDLELRWSRFLPDSEVSRLNAAGGAPVRVSPETVTLLTAARDAALLTDGRFDPLLLDAVEAIGYRETFAVAGPAGGRARAGPPARRCRRHRHRPRRPHRRRCRPAPASIPVGSARASPPTWSPTSCARSVPRACA